MKRRAKKSLSRGLGFNHSRKIKGPKKAVVIFMALTPPFSPHACSAAFAWPFLPTVVESFHPPLDRTDCSPRKM